MRHDDRLTSITVHVRVRLDGAVIGVARALIAEYQRLAAGNARS
jgi:hypothetical protein